MKATKRYLAIKAAYDFLGDFPEPYNTHHTAVCHHGYSWRQPNGFPTEFVMINDDGDMITREDFNEIAALLESPIILKLGQMDCMFNTQLFTKHELITDATIADALDKQTFNGKQVTGILELCDEIKKISRADNKKFFIQTYNPEVVSYRWDA